MPRMNGSISFDPFVDLSSPFEESVRIEASREAADFIAEVMWSFWLTSDDRGAKEIAEKMRRVLA